MTHEQHRPVVLESRPAIRQIGSRLRALRDVMTGVAVADPATARSRERYRRIVVTVATSGVGRLVGMLVGLVTVPLALNALGKEQYGLWATITAVVAWVGLFDFGLVNGLVNAIAEANGRDDRAGAREYVSTAFFLLLGIAGTLALVGLIAVPLLDWGRLLGVAGTIADGTVRRAVIAGGACVLATLPLSIVRQVYAGYQRAHVVTGFATLGSLLTLGAVALTAWKRGSLPVFVVAFGATGPIAMLLNLGYLVLHEMPWVRPSIRHISRSALARLKLTSVPLFAFQLGALMVNQTQAIVLANVAGLAVVADFSLLWRLYLLMMSVLTMTTYPMVPPLREAYERGDIQWARLAFRRMLALRVGLAMLGSGVLMLAGNRVIALWLHRGDVRFGTSVWLALAVTCVTAVWVSTFADLLVIMDRIWTQVWLVLLNGAATIVLTATLARVWGVVGAVIAIGATTTIVSTWLLPFIAARALPGIVGRDSREPCRTSR